ncbi:unnamed protein product [Rhizophagus irregularis]|nr:unnamed protein product [Rhizophagus irregularis]
MLMGFDDAYEGVSSLRSIKESKQEEPLTKNKIETNLRVLKTNLKNSKAPYAHHFRKYLKKKSTSDLSWRIPLASQVICADSEMARTLEVEAYNFFMDPAERMKVTAPELVKDHCDSFVLNFIDSITDVPNNRLLHDKSWKESNEKLAKVTLVEIPIQPTDGNTVFKFVETLLTIRNILHVNISLLYYALPTSSSSNTENSSTVSSPPRSSSPSKMKKRKSIKFEKKII